MAVTSNILVQKLRNGAAAIVVVRLIGFLTGMATSALIARMISVGELGTYFLILNLAGLFAIFSHFGTPNVVLKRVADSIAQDESDVVRQILKSVSGIMLLSSLFFSTIIYIFRVPIFELGLNNDQISNLIGYLILWSVGLGIQAIFSELFRAHQKFFLAALTKAPLSGLITLSISTVLYIYFKVGFIEVLLVSSLSPLLTSIISAMYYYRMLMPPLRGSEDSQNNINQLASNSIPLFMYGVAAYIGSHADIWLISIMSEPNQLGLYGAAARLMILAGVTLTIANGIVPPFISKFRAKSDFIGMEKMLRSVATIAAIPSIIIVLFFLFFSDTVLTFIFGAPYAEAANILVILAIGQLSSVFVGSCGYVLIMYGKNNILMRTTMLSSITSVVLAIILSQYFEVMISVAFSFAFGKVMSQLLQLYFCKKYCEINTSIYLNPKLKNL
jgi:O-antigen/teichoic acid export membrane protein